VGYSSIYYLFTLLVVTSTKFYPFQCLLESSGLAILS